MYHNCQHSAHFHLYWISSESRRIWIFFCEGSKSLSRWIHLHLRAALAAQSLPVSACGDTRCPVFFFSVWHSSVVAPFEQYLRVLSKCPRSSEDCPFDCLFVFLFFGTINSPLTLKVPYYTHFQIFTSNLFFNWCSCQATISLTLLGSHQIASLFDKKKGQICMLFSAS